MANRPFVVDAGLTAIAVNFSNPSVSLIADAVLPRVNVGGELYKYDYFPEDEIFTVPDTTIGRRGHVNEVEFSAEQRTAKVVDRGLDSPIPQSDIDSAKNQKAKGNSNYDPEARAVEGVKHLVELDREIRVAALVHDASNYDADKTEALAGTDQWTDIDNSDPLTDITDACDKTFIARPNIAVTSRRVFTVLSRHPVIVESVFGTGAKRGKVRREEMAELFELEEILIGDSYVNTARRGQAAAYARTWGNHFALLHRNRAATNTNGLPTFGITAEWRKFGSSAMMAGRYFDPKAGGLEGGVTVRAGEYVQEHLVAPSTGYLIENAIAAAA